MPGMTTSSSTTSGGAAATAASASAAAAGLGDLVTARLERAADQLAERARRPPPGRGRAARKSRRKRKLGVPAGTRQRPKRHDSGHNRERSPRRPVDKEGRGCASLLPRAGRKHLGRTAPTGIVVPPDSARPETRPATLVEGSSGRPRSASRVRWVLPGRRKSGRDAGMRRVWASTSAWTRVPVSGKSATCRSRNGGMPLPALTCRTEECGAGAARRGIQPVAGGPARGGHVDLQRGW